MSTDGTAPGPGTPPLPSARPGARPASPPGRPADPIRAPAHQVSPRARTYWAVRAALGWSLPLLLEVIALLAGWRFPPRPGLLLAITLPLAVAHVLVMPPWRYRVHRWELTAPEPRSSTALSPGGTTFSAAASASDDVLPAVYTRSGWWTQRWRIAPLSRVQTVDTTRGPLARVFGLSTVTVTTASAAGPVEISAVDTAVAEEIAQQATDAAQATRDDAT